MTPIEARVDTHEAVCELRYDSINARLKRIEQKDEFLADCGDEGQKYVSMAGW